MMLGMGDTGIDFEHCMFHDSNAEIPYTVAAGLSTEAGSGIPYYQNATHRKVRRTYTCTRLSCECTSTHLDHVPCKAYPCTRK